MYTPKKDKFNLIVCSNIIVALYVVEFQPNNKEEEGQYWPRLIALESGERTSLTWQTRTFWQLPRKHQFNTGS